jgi:two-component system chemotaxis response regulator CheB
MEVKEVLEATCPDCHGPLSEIREGDGLCEYRCLVGHAYSAGNLLAAHSEAEEQALWGAVVALEMATTLANAVGPQFSPEIAEELRVRAQEKAGQAMEIRDILKRLEPFRIV